MGGIQHSRKEEGIQYLPRDILEDIIAHYKNYIAEAGITSVHRRSEYIEKLINKTDILPEDLQREIDERRGNMRQGNYLSLHPDLLLSLDEPLDSP